MQETSVVLGLEDPVLEEEVLHFLDGVPGIRVVGAAADGIRLSREVHDRRPGAIVVSPQVAARSAGHDGAAVLVVATSETTQALRAAMRAGARGFYVWPAEREKLGEDARAAARPRARKTAKSGRVVAVCGARGGAGTTFLATNLAAAFTDQGVETVLVDLDVGAADVTVALGLPPDAPPPAVASLSGVTDELRQEQLDGSLHAHPRGFRALLAPVGPAPGRPPDPDRVAAIVRYLRSAFETVVLHLPRSFEESTAAALAESDVILLVATLDVFALRHAKRQLESLSELGINGRCRLVLNRVARGEIVPDDAHRVLGLAPLCQIRIDPAVPRAQNRGELVAGRSCPAARRVVSLAKRLLDEEAS